MMSVNLRFSFRAGNAGRSRFLRFLWWPALLLLLPLYLPGQGSELLPAEGESPLFALHRTDPALDTPAEPTEFVIIRGAELSRIITLHRDGETADASISLANVTGEFEIGTWPAEIKPVPGADNLSYWIVYPDKRIPPGKYRITVSHPQSWVNSAGTTREGMVWVFSRTELSL